MHGRPLLTLLFLAGCSLPPIRWGESSPVDTGAVPPKAPEGSLTGLVTDADGAPIQGVWVTTDPHGYEVLTDENGAWTIRHLPPDTYRVLSGGSSWVTAEATGIQVQADAEQTVDLLLLPLLNEGDGRLRVQVAGPDGLPLEGAEVMVDAENVALTDENGRATLLGLAGLSITVTVSDPEDRLWSSDENVTMPNLGGFEISFALSGRPAVESYVIDDITCIFCHLDQGAAWLETPHARALASTIESPFLDAFDESLQVDLGNGATATLGYSGSTPSVTLKDAGGQSLTLSIAGLIGDASSSSVPWIEAIDQAYPLPIAWVAANDAFPDWPETAARVVPFDTSTWFDESGSFDLAKDHPDPSLSAEARCFACHADGYELTLRSDGGVDMTSSSTGGRWARGGVGCQSCHGPGSSHLLSPTEEKLLTITQPELLDRDRQNEVCGQCHSQRLGVDNNLPFSWSSTEGSFQPGCRLEDYSTPTPVLWSNESSALPNSQADELALSLHGADSIAPLLCVDCHEPHGAARGKDDTPIPDMLRQDPSTNDSCNSCHLGLDWEGDIALMEAHSAHETYAPADATQAGRCTGCHMPATATRIDWNTAAGSGDLTSHSFVRGRPHDTLDAFTAAGVDVMSVGTFPIHGCAGCHVWNAWLGDQVGDPFGGTWGDPTLLATHEAYLAEYEEIFP